MRGERSGKGEMVSVIVCSDPVDAHVWIHGVYESHESALRVYARLCDESYYNVRLDRQPIKKPTKMRKRVKR